jgi:hypothetical protein
VTDLMLRVCYVTGETPGFRPWRSVAKRRRGLESTLSIVAAVLLVETRFTVRSYPFLRIETMSQYSIR